MAATSTSDSGWPGGRLALLLCATFAVCAAGGIGLLNAFVAFQATLPPPPIGVWASPEPANIVWGALRAQVIAYAIAIPALVTVWWLGTREGVTAAHVLTGCFIGLIVMGLLGGSVPPLVRAVTGVAAPDGSSTSTSTIFVAPVVEETLKAVAILLTVAAGARHLGLRSGLLLGIAVGIGINVGETVNYAVREVLSDPTADTMPTIALRSAALGMSLHPTTAALIGAAIGTWLASRRRVPSSIVALAGLVAAVAVHAAWNRYATDVLNSLLGEIGTRVDVGSPLSLFGIGTAVAVLFLMLPWLALAVAWWRAGATRG